MCAAIFNDELDKRLGELVEQWNIAERRIKKAEKKRNNEVVSSAIYELRYAGRKFIDVVDLARSNDWENDPSILDTMSAYLADATEDCVKAKHDAIDAMLDFVTVWLNDAEQKLGLDQLVSHFPQYNEVISKIAQWNEEIEASRGDRISKRDEIYNDFENADFDEILSFYDMMRQSEERVTLAIRRAKIQNRIKFWATILGPIVGVFLTLAVQSIL